MPGELYDAAHIARFYDEYGDQEWDRLEATLQGRASFATHVAALERHLQPNATVLEIGAGPGRFTIELARLQASVFVADISPVQLEAHRQRISTLPAESAVTGRQLADISDLSGFPDASYDAVVAYGGPISYVFDRAEQALAHVHRVLRPGGLAFISVMSLLGAARIFRRAVAALSEAHGLELALDEVLRSGDLYDERLADRGHRCRLYRSAQITELMEASGLTVVGRSASNYLLSEADGLQSEGTLSEETISGFLRREVEICREPGVLDAGSHIILVGQRPAAPRPTDP